MKFVNPKNILSDMGDEQSELSDDMSKGSKNKMHIVENKADGPNSDLKIVDNMSSINSFNDSKKVNENTKTSYYVRDKFQPLKSHQTNIEKLLNQFKD